MKSSNIYSEVKFLFGLEILKKRSNKFRAKKLRIKNQNFSK